MVLSAIRPLGRITAVLAALAVLRTALSIAKNRALARRVRFTDGACPCEMVGMTALQRLLVGVFGAIRKAGNLVVWQRANLLASHPDALFMAASFLGHPSVTLADPKAIQAVLSSQAASFGKFPANVSRFKMIMGEYSMLAIDGDMHKTHRRVITPLFNLAALKKLVPTMEVSIEELLGVLDATAVQPAAEVDVQRLSISFALNVIGRTALATDFDALNPSRTHPLHTAYNSLLGLFGFHRWALIRSLFPWAIHVPVEENMAVKRAHDYVFAEMDAIVRRIQVTADGGSTDEPSSSKIAKSTLATVLLDAQSQTQANGAGTLPLIEIRDELLTFLVAGHETTANAISMTLWFLAANLKEQDKLVAALMALGPDPSLDALLALPELANVVHESLRLHSPAFSARRAALHDVHVPLSDGRALILPKGMEVVIPIQAIHLLPSNFSDPLDFQPDRWNAIRMAGSTDHQISGGTSTTVLHPGQYLPFFFGPRVCVGRQFAVLELKLSVARILARFQVSLPADPDRQQRPACSYAVTAKPKAVPLRFEKRQV
ncbi:cytochrome P450 [Blastocladiella britannica]|nr:cytochrome P450 [Blastocladiella britannica]